MASSESKKSPSPKIERDLEPLSSTEKGKDVVVDAEASHIDTANVKLASDGHTILLPQPSSSQYDPLNWSWRKKHIILFVVSFTGFLADFSSAAPVPLIQVQGAYWHMSPNVVNYAGNLNVAFLAIGGIFWSAVASFWGRLPVMFWTTLLGAVCVLITAATTSWPVFYAFRTLTGFFLSSYQAVGLAVIKDMFFFHEHARKIGIWVVAFVVSPYIGPLFGYFMLAGTGDNTPDAGDWRAVLYMVFGVVCLDLVCVILLADETYYDRKVPELEQPNRGSRILRLLGVWQIRNSSYFPTAGQAVMRLFKLITEPTIILGLLYYMLSFMWSVGINITSAILYLTPAIAGGFGYTPRALGFLYFTPIVGALIGEAFGHFFNDLIAARSIRKRGGIFHPEVRLVTNYIAAVLMIPGLVAVGQALQFHRSVGVVVIGWGMYICGVMMASVAISAYLLGLFPVEAAEVSGLINAARTIGGFTVGYYQMEWGTKSGFDTSFGIQAGIVAAATVLVVVLQVFGPKLRKRASV